MKPNGAHVQIHRRVFLPTELLGHGEAVKAGLVGEFARLRQQLLPLFRRQTLVVPLRARGLTAVVEEAVVVVAVLQREDGRRDELVEAS